MANSFDRCFTPTSLWRFLQEHGTGRYNLIIDNNSIKVIKQERETKLSSNLNWTDFKKKVKEIGFENTIRQAIKEDK